ncbi:hypothetical protein OSB04_026643 [Centaurea solstitialis]|uniref:Uncharacterized protein n=1 Tax=Centaurea solstitialis TaxID=347529 RepID=A0AA38VYY0_9ASTR|nr:hypothetical protein OSB04_026643 [Centaurea solstitialis]
MEESNGSSSSRNINSGCDGAGEDNGHTCNRTFGEKCRHIAKKQRAKFYIVRRCIAMLILIDSLNVLKPRVWYSTNQQSLEEIEYGIH